MLFNLNISLLLISQTIKSLALCICCCVSAFAWGQQAPTAPIGLFVWMQPGHVTDTVGLRTGIAEGETLLLRAAFKSQVEPLQRIWVLEGFETEAQAERAMRALTLDYSRVQFVEKIPVYTFFHTPNDLQSVQWNLKTIAAEQAWDLSQGGKGVIVGLVDDGFDTAHVDLQPTLWHNPKEIPGNGKDDDANGYVDDVYGWDMADNDSDPHVKPADNLQHGTHCGGILGARTNNSAGIASIGYNLKIMPIKCGQNGSPFIYNPYAGIEYCVNQGARVISMSWGGGAYSATYQAIFDYALSKNVVCVAAAGNSSTSRTMYPAGYNHVIAVGSTATGDKVSSFSNYGTWVDVMAPGSAIYSTLPGNAYGNFSGTSMACPLVSGLCALMLSKNPSLRVKDLEACLKSGCENIDATNPSYVGNMGSGRINAYRSMKCLKAVSADAYISKTQVCTKDTVLFINTTPTPITMLRWTFAGGSPASSTAQKPVVRYNSSGTFMVRLWVSNGTDQDSVEYSITVGRPTAQFVGNQSIYKGDFGTLKVQFSGIGPWTLKYTDGSNTNSISGIQSNPYYLLVKPNTTTTYKPLEVSQNGCIGEVYDSCLITVLPPPLGSNNCDSGYKIHVNLGGTGVDYALDIDSYNDSTAIVVGKTQLGSGSGDGYVCRFNLMGKTEWFKTFGGTREDGLYTVVTDKDGSIYAGGYTYSDVPSRAAVLMKLDGAGNQIWRKVYGNNSEYIYNVSISKNRKYIYFTGMSIDNSYGSEDFTIYKIDSNGSVVWIKQVGNSELNRNHTLAEDANGKDIYVIGNMGDPHPRLHGVMCKMDENGGVVWTKKYQLHDDYQVSLHDIKVWNAKELMVYGFLGKNTNGNLTTTREFFLARMGTDGSVKWAKKYVYKTSNPWRMELIGNNILLSGGNDNNGGDGYLVLLDSNGNVLQARNLGANASEFIYGVDITAKQEILFAGSQLRGGITYSWIGKTGCKIGALCEGSDFAPAVSDLVMVSSSITYNVKDFSNSVTPNHSKGTPNPKLSIICQSPKNSEAKPPCDLKADFEMVDNCLQDSVHFIDRSAGGKYKPNLHQWSFGDGDKGAGAWVKHAYMLGGSYQVTLKVIGTYNNYVCVDSITKTYVASDSFRIQRMSRDTSICLGDSVQLSAISTLCGAPLYKYSWTPIAISDAQAAQPWVAPKSTQTYTVSITDGKGRITTGKVRVSVNLNCCKSVARIGMPPTLCEGDSIRFKNSSTAASNASYTWYMPGSNVAQYNGFQAPGVIYKKSGVYTVVLILADACGRDTVVEEIFIYPKPFVDAGKDSTVCKADTLPLGADPIGRNVYQWTPATDLSNANISNPEARVTAPVVYILQVLSEYGCRNADTVNIGFGNPPQFKLGADTSICYGESLVLRAPDIVGAEYKWTPSQGTKEFKVIQSGTYILEMKNACGRSYDTILVQLTDCLCPIYVPNAFSPSKNQINDKFEVVFTCPYQHMTMRIYNHWGEKLFESDETTQAWDGRYKGNKVPADMYTYIIEIQSARHFGGATFYKSGVVYVLD